MTKNPKMRMANPNFGHLHKNIDHAATLGLSMLTPGCHKDARGAVVCGTGPTLLEPKSNLRKVRELADKGYIIIAVKEAVTLLTKRGIKVHYTVAMDPDAKQIEKTPLVKGVTYLLASSCDPRMFKHCLDGGMDVKIFHSACGAENEIPRYHHLFGDTTVAEGGYTVINRAYAVAKIMGITPARIYIAGAPFGWRKEQSYYADGVKGKPGNSVGPEWSDGGKVDGTPWFTKLDLLTSAQDLAKRIKNGEAQTIGDSLAQALSRHPVEFIEAICKKQLEPVRNSDPRTTRFRMEVDPAYDIRLIHERLSPPRLSVDGETFDVMIVPPRWVPEAPAQTQGV